MKNSFDSGNEEEKSVWHTAFAWMEHRRWNAFLRTQGFSHATEGQNRNLFDETTAHKDIKDRKLHNCLVEVSMRGNKMPKNAIEYAECSKYDSLDMASLTAYSWMINRDSDSSGAADDLQRSEYKQWDYYGDNDPEAKKMLDMTPRDTADEDTLHGSEKKC